ncbi:MAG: diadenylate cyclase CdaA [Alistipes sp.]|nr:diadenylate cyclase CdaA [Alistipes sp.]
MDFIRITIVDILDIFSIAVIMYYMYKITRGTQAPNILTGIILIYLLWIVVRALNMEMLSAVLGHIIGVGVVALIVVFQPEIRRFLQVLGKRGRQRRSSFLGKLFDFREEKHTDMSFLNPMVKACADMSASKTGALIVIQEYVDLGFITETGITLDANISSSLLKNIFFKNSPMHDGAVVINNGRVVAAKCVLPSTQSDVPISFGMRHRAALGVTEITDAIVVVVSEETGAISIARNGKIKIGIAPEALYQELLAMMETVSEEQVKAEATAVS